MKKFYIILAVSVAIGVVFFLVQSSNPDLNGLDGKSWQLVRVMYSDGKEVLPKTEGDFVLTLKGDSTFSLKTDCNNIGGEYVSEGNLISFKNIFSTKMYCEGAKEEEISMALQKSKSFFYDSNGNLVIDLDMDSGSIYFK